MKEKKPFSLKDLQKELNSRSRKKKPKKKLVEKINYDDCIVAFIDLLGFSKKIENSNKKESIELIRNLEWIMEKIVNPSHPSKIKASYFSDCICLSQVLPKNDSQDYLDSIFHFLLGLIHIQGELIFQGEIVRGGVSIDRHYSSDRLIFSKGLLRSYSIESKKAVNPVIMLDDSVYEKLIKIHSKKPGGYLNQNHYLSKVNSLLSLSVQLPSGEHVLNYLSFWREVDHHSNIIPYFMKHKELIERGAKEQAKEKTILEKYRWMAKYHNYYLLKVYELKKRVRKRFAY